MYKFSAFLLTGMLLSFSAQLDELSADERGVWKMEEAYYEFAKANDPKSFLALFDEDVVGWPALDKVQRENVR